MQNQNLFSCFLINKTNDINKVKLYLRKFLTNYSIRYLSTNKNFLLNMVYKYIYL